MAKSVKNNELYRLISEKSKDLICVLDSDGYFVYANPAFKTILGYTPSKIIGTNFLSIIHTNDRDSVIKMFEESFIKKETIASEIRYKHSDGTWLPFEPVSSMISSAGEPDKLILISRALAERQQWEERIVKAKEKAEEEAEFKSWFLSAMSHEIRTPINVILGYSNLLKDIWPVDNNEGEVFFKNISKAGKRLLNIISQILDIAKLEAGEFPLHLEKLNLNMISKSLLELVKITAEEKNLKINFVQNKKNVYVHADEYCLQGIIINLISNAIKYTDEGNINLIISSDEKFGKIIVEDEGIGMSEEYLHSIFQVFKRDEQTLKKRYEGFGLGLALTKKFIDLMNGDIEVITTKDIGTKVIVLLPLLKSEVPA